MNWDKIDKFYIVLGATLFLLALLVIFSFRGVFSAYLSAYEIDQKELSSGGGINKEGLQEAYSWVINKETVPLEVR